MSTTNAEPPSSLPRILCLHGGGSSGQIFYYQTHRLRRHLSAHFRFVFALGPVETAPGPGILPYFADCGPYRSWVAREREAVTKADEAAEEAAVDGALAAALEADGGSGEVVGAMGFSAGAAFATELLLRAQRLRRLARDGFHDGDDPARRWKRSLAFAVLLCGSWPPWRGRGVGDTVAADSPSVHLHGLADPFLSYGRGLLRDCYEAAGARVMEFEGGHHMPVAVRDSRRLARLVLSVAGVEGAEEEGGEGEDEDDHLP